MQKAAQTATTICILLIAIPAINLQSVLAQQSDTSAAPKILWQQNYDGDYSVLWNIPSVTNLIETNDGGFAFMTMGFPHFNMHPSILFKVDSTGNLQWTEQFDYFIASTIIQTSDGGYEISGEWANYYGIRNATLIKTDPNGTMQWSCNYTAIPQLNVNSAVLQNGSNVSTMIETSDSGYAYVDWAMGRIIKTDANKEIEWYIKTNYSDARTIQLDRGSFTIPAISAAMCSLIETSDGALAGLGIALSYFDNVYSCSIVLIKTVSFLPPPQQTALPTPIPTPITLQTIFPQKTWLALLPIIVGCIVIAILLIYKKHINRPSNTPNYS
jgi:hypothetical protein